MADELDELVVEDVCDDELLDVELELEDEPDVSPNT